MKKAYEKPTLVLREKLSEVSAAPAASDASDAPT
jgi:hypothetical protein